MIRLEALAVCRKHMPKCFRGGGFPNEYALCLRMAVKSQFFSSILCNLSKATLVPGDSKCLKFERDRLH